MFVFLIVLGLLLLGLGAFIAGLGWLAVAGGVVLVGTLGWRGLNALEQRNRDEP